MNDKISSKVEDITNTAKTKRKQAENTTKILET